MDGHTRRDGVVYGGIKPTITTNLGEAEITAFTIFGIKNPFCEMRTLFRI